MDIPERDWKHLRTLVDRGWERACTRALGELRALLDDPGRTSPQRFDAALDLLKVRARELDRALSDMRRSTASLRLLGLLTLDLVEPAELEGFSAPVRARIASMRTCFPDLRRSDGALEASKTPEVGPSP
jgi:hypothetical protein